MKRGFAAGIVALSLCLMSVSLRAEVAHVELDRFPLGPGVAIRFATHQQAIKQASYETWIELVDVWHDGAEYTYEMVEPGHTSAGRSLILDREGCTALDPWWGGDAPVVRVQRCDLWLSTRAYYELMATGQALMNPDLTVRGDVSVRLELTRRDVFRCHIDGFARELPVMVLASSAGDELWVYDDPDNPFVLQSFIEGAYSWFVTDIYVHVAAPADRGSRSVPLRSP